MAKAFVWAATLTLAACGPFPDDVDGTTARIERDGVVRVAFVELAPADETVALRYVERVATAAGARVARQPNAATERALARLEHGELDLVMAEIATDSPWRSHVAVLEPLGTRLAGERRLTLSPVARNGENRWIALLEREARDMVAGR